MTRLVQSMKFGFPMTARGFVIAAVLLFLGTGAVHGQQMVVVTAGSVDPNAANGWTVLTLTLSAPSSDTVTAQFATADTAGTAMAPATATAPTDYLATSGTLVFAPGVTQQQIQVTMVNSTGSGWFWVILSNPQNAVLDMTEIMVNVADPPPPPTVQFASANYYVNENDPTGMATVVVTLNSAPLAPVCVFYTIDGGANIPLNFLTGATSASITIPITDDGVPGPDTIVTLQLTVSTDATIGEPSTAVLTILNDNVTPWGIIVSSNKSAICAGGINSTPSRQL